MESVAILWQELYAHILAAQPQLTFGNSFHREDLHILQTSKPSFSCQNNMQSFGQA